MNVTSTQFQSYTRTRESQIAQEAAVEPDYQDPQESFVFSDRELSTKEKLSIGAWSLVGGTIAAVPGAAGIGGQGVSALIDLNQGKSAPAILSLSSALANFSAITMESTGLGVSLYATSVVLGAAAFGLSTYEELAKSPS